MKTKNLLLVAFLCTGLLMTSYGQDKGSHSLVTKEQSFTRQQSSDLNKSISNVSDIKIDPITNFPDPFVGKTTIQYRLWASGKVSLTIRNSKGEPVVYLANGYQRDGIHSYEFDARDLPAGIYVAVLRLGTTVVRETMEKKDHHSRAPFPGTD